MDSQASGTGGPPPVPRGRGAQLRALMERCSQAPAPPGPLPEAAAPEEPPRPRGRAKLMEKIAEMQKGPACAGQQQPPALSVPVQSRLPSAVAPHQRPLSVASVTESLAETFISEVSTYHGECFSVVFLTHNIQSSTWRVFEKTIYSCQIAMWPFL